MLYSIVNVWYDSNQVILVEGPEVPDWAAFCNMFMAQAARNAIIIQTDLLEKFLEKPFFSDPDLKSPDPIGWRNILEQLVLLFKKHGYIVIKPIRAEYWGSEFSLAKYDNNAEERKHEEDPMGVEVLGPVFQEVLDFNKKYDEEFLTRLEAENERTAKELEDDLPHNQS